MRSISDKIELKVYGQREPVRRPPMVRIGEMDALFTETVTQSP